MYDYPWAANPVKLGQSVAALTEKKKLDPSVVIDEKSIKAEYIKRAGKVLDVPEEVKEAKPEEAEVKKEVKPEAKPEEKHHDGRKKHG